jgi:ABC-type multidrug transport system ATPase subunit
MTSNNPPAIHAPVLRALGLRHHYPGAPLFDHLDLELWPGLSLVLGGDGRGKTTLLRILAGELAPTSGSIMRDQDGAALESAADPADDPVVARAWLGSRQARHAGWEAKTAERLAEAFGLGPHLDKPLYMLSTGSRRKLGLVAAAASGAALTLLDTPYAALDAPSTRVLTALLGEAATQRRRAWVIADHAPPPGADGWPIAGIVNLGD